MINITPNYKIKLFILIKLKDNYKKNNKISIIIRYFNIILLYNFLSIINNFYIGKSNIY
jgi:hypothetical protein